MIAEAQVMVAGILWAVTELELVMIKVYLVVTTHFQLIVMMHMYIKNWLNKL